jgi:hypothetical protein
VPGEPYLIPVGVNSSSYIANLSRMAPQAPGSYGGHFWSGFQYTGSWGQAYALTTEIQVPDDPPEAGSFVYFGLLSAYDSSGNYDQIGIMENWLPPSHYASSPSDAWYIAWASAGQCGGPAGFNSTNWGIDSYPLIQGQVYNLTMEVYGAQGGGTGITFQVNQVGWHTGPPLGAIWTHYYNYQNPFWLGESNWGNGNGQCSNDDGYTDYEEEYVTSQQLLPNWNSYFWQNWGYTYAGYFPVTSWHSFYNAASGYRVPSPMHYYQNGADLQVDNEYFTLNFTVPGASFAKGGAVVMSGHSDNDNASLCTGAACAVSSLTVLSISPAGQGLTATFSPTSGNPYFGFTLTVSAPSTALCQLYTVETKAYSSALNAFTTAMFIGYVTGCPPSHGGGGGGYSGGTTCNVLIWTPAGYETACYFTGGSQIYVWNFNTGAPTSATVRNVTTTTQNVTISFDHGLLKTSAYRQPVYTWNASFKGWIEDPQNLTIGDLLWNPQNETWIPIDSITYQFGTATFYDIDVAGSWNNYQGDSVSLGSQW